MSRGESARLHRETGEAVRDAELWAVGAFAAEYAAGARRAGAATRLFADKPALAAALSEVFAEGTVVLLKASRGAAFEEVLDLIGAEG